MTTGKRLFGAIVPIALACVTATLAVANIMARRNAVLARTDVTFDVAAHWSGPYSLNAINQAVDLHLNLYNQAGLAKNDVELRAENQKLRNLFGAILKLAPTNGNFWYFLAEFSARQNGFNSASGDFFAMSYRTARLEVPVMIKRIGLGTRFWAKLDAATRSLVENDMRALLLYKPQKDAIGFLATALGNASPEALQVAKSTMATFAPEYVQDFELLSKKQ